MQFSNLKKTKSQENYFETTNFQLGKENEMDLSYSICYFSLIFFEKKLFVLIVLILFINLFINFYY